MSTAPDASETDLVAVERALEPCDGGLVVTVTVRSLADAPLVVRFSDPVGKWSGADGVRIHPETEPERWTLDGATLVAELLVAPDEPATVGYDLEGADRDADPDPPTVERAQATDPEAVEAGRVPRFRDARAFDGTGADAPDPAGSGEATDADVRRAVEAVSDSRSRRPENEFLDERPDPIDLVEPDGES